MSYLGLFSVDLDGNWNQVLGSEYVQLKWKWHHFSHPPPGDQDAGGGGHPLRSAVDALSHPGGGQLFPPNRTNIAIEKQNKIKDLKSPQANLLIEIWSQKHWVITLESQ